MARVLILSSQVSYGHVGLSAALPALTLLGHQVTALPTTLLSNHPGWSHVGGAPVPVEQLAQMIEALAANGWLGEHDALLTGYLPNADHVALAGKLIRRMRGANPGIRVVVDPVMGDDPKGLYVDEQVAVAVRDRLIGHADIITPNVFELGWLSGKKLCDLAQISRATATIGVPAKVTSVPSDNGNIGVMCQDGKQQRLYCGTELDAVPNGVGDVFSALVTAGVSDAQTMGYLQKLVEASSGKKHLQITETAEYWTAANPLSPISQADTDWAQ